MAKKCHVCGRELGMFPQKCKICGRYACYEKKHMKQFEDICVICKEKMK